MNIKMNLSTRNKSFQKHDGEFNADVNLIYKFKFFLGYLGYYSQ